MKNFIDVACGRKKADIVLRNCKIVNVFSKELENGNLAIYKDKIVGIGDYSGNLEIDLNGAILMPSFIDSHAHIESSMVTPKEYAKAILPKGVTTVIADPHEIANVCGIEGIEFMQECAESIPLDVHFMIPSCVPATTFENAGAVIDSNDVKQLNSTKKYIGLGEMMNYPGLIYCDEEVLNKLQSADFIDGHCPLLKDNDLNAYIGAGIYTDHECSNTEEALRKISNGMYVQIREGTCSKNLKDLLPAVNSKNSDRFLFCSDDRYLGDIINQGTINYCVKTAIKSGIDPIDAVKIASHNAALCYGLKKRGAIAPGYFADLVVIDNFNDFNILKVFKDGTLCAENGKLLIDIPRNTNNKNVKDTVNRINLNEDSFKDNKLSGDNVTAIKVIPESLITEKVIAKIGTHTSKVCVIERHNKKNSIGIGYVVDYNIKNGAIASSIGHDSHNIIVIGDNDKDMLLAVETLGKQGGIAVCSEGNILEYLELSIAGLISDKGYEDVLKTHENLHKVTQKLNINEKLDPFMLLAFLPLPVIPEIRITDSGLFDVNKFEFIKEN